MDLRRSPEPPTKSGNAALNFCIGTKQDPTPPHPTVVTHRFQAPDSLRRTEKPYTPTHWPTPEGNRNPLPRSTAIRQAAAGTGRYFLFLNQALTRTVPPASQAWGRHSLAPPGLAPHGGLQAWAIHTNSGLAAPPRARVPPHGVRDNDRPLGVPWIGPSSSA